MSLGLNFSGVHGIRSTHPVAINQRVKAKFASGQLVRVAVVGDSVQRNSGVADINTLPSNGTTGAGWLGALCHASGQMYQVAGGQTPGENMYQIATTQMDDVLAFNDDAKPDVLFFLPSLNALGTIDGYDLTSYGDEAEGREIVNGYIDTVFSKAYSNGIAVITADGWPNNTIATDSTKRTNFTALYNMMGEAAVRNQALTHLNLVGGSEYCTSTAAFLSTAWSGDGVHLDGHGHRSFAIEAYRQMQEVIPMRPYYTIPGLDDSGTSFMVASFTPTSGTPSGWSQNDSALTWQNPEAGDSNGDWNVVSATTDSETIIFNNSVTFPAGDYMLICVEAKSDIGSEEISNVPYFNVRLTNVTGTHNLYNIPATNQFGERGWMARHIWKVEDSNNSVGIWFYVKGGPWIADVKWRFRVYNLSDLGINPYTT